MSINVAQIVNQRFQIFFFVKLIVSYTEVKCKYLSFYFEECFWRWSEAALRLFGYCWLYWLSLGLPQLLRWIFVSTKQHGVTSCPLQSTQNKLNSVHFPTVWSIFSGVRSVYEKRLLCSSCLPVCSNVTTRLSQNVFSWNLIFQFSKNL